MMGRAVVKSFKRAKDIRVGTIGYSASFHMGRAHLTEAARAGMTPVAVCELDPSRLEAARQDFPDIETYSSVTEMLKKSGVNLVAIITPHNTHLKLTLQCLRAGSGVVVEKPFAITTAECDTMIAEAKKRKLVLSTYHNRHWDGHMLHALKTVRSGTIGDVVRVEAHGCGWGPPGKTWRSSKSMSGGILHDWGVHFLEYALQLIDSDIVEVTGFTKTGVWAKKSPWKKDTNEDEAFAVVRFSSGAWLTLHMSSIDGNPRRGMLETTGTKGTYIMDHAQWEIITHEGGATVTRKGRNPPGEGWRFYRNLADHMTKGKPLVISPEWARRPIHILDLAYQSARKGCALKSKYK
jgi:predicted dehydrogenase